jgi:hypothetical protein
VSDIHPAIPSRINTPRPTPEEQPGQNGADTTRRRVKRAVKAGKKRKAKKVAPRRAAAAAPANPNRPLEAKNKLHAVLGLADKLRKPQLVVFAEIMDKLEATPRGSRKVIIDALVRVYG